MIPTRNLIQRINASIANHLIALHTISALQVVPVGIDFSPNPEMTPAEVPTSDFATTFGTRVLALPLFQYLRDPVTDEEVLTFIFASTGADRQMVDGSDNPLPRTVHGYAMKTADDGAVIGAKKFADPIAYTEILQAVQWGEISFRYPTSAIT